MAVRSKRDIYNILEKHLRAVAEPLTVTALMDIKEIRDEALTEFADGKTDSASVVQATNKLSDTLGFMWRRNLLTRYPAPKETHSFARFAYIWDQQRDSKPINLEPMRRAQAGKVGFTVTEVDDGVLLEFQKFTVMIKQKEER